MHQPTERAKEILQNRVDDSPEERDCLEESSAQFCVLRTDLEKTTRD